MVDAFTTNAFVAGLIIGGAFGGAWGLLPRLRPGVVLAGAVYFGFLFAQQGFAGVEQSLVYKISDIFAHNYFAWAIIIGFVICSNAFHRSGTQGG